MNADHEEAQSSAEWLDREETVARAERIRRLDWMAHLVPQSTTYLLGGGLESVRLFDEVRYCYAYGQHLAVTILGVAFVERMIAARFYASGRNDLERAGGLDLLRAALDETWITIEEFERFDRLRRIRNPLAHFRRPMASDTLAGRMIGENRSVPDIVEKDAQDVLEGAIHVLQRFARVP